MGPLTCGFMVRPAGLEPATYGLEAGTPVVRKDTSKYVLVRFSARAFGPTRQKRTESYELMRKLNSKPACGYQRTLELR